MWLVRYIPIIGWLVGDKCTAPTIESVPQPSYKFNVSEVKSMTLPFTTSFRIGINDKGWIFPDVIREFTDIINSNGNKYDDKFYYVIRSLTVTEYNNALNVPITIHFKAFTITDDGRIVMLENPETHVPLKYTCHPESATRVSDGEIISSKFDKDGIIELFAPLREKIVNFRPYHDTDNLWSFIPIDHPFYKLLITYFDEHKEYLEKSLKIKLIIVPEYNEKGIATQVKIPTEAFTAIRDRLKLSIFDNVDLIAVSNSVFCVDRTSLPELTTELRLKFEKLLNDRYTYNVEDRPKELSVSVSLIAEVIRYPISDKNQTQSSTQSIQIHTKPDRILDYVNPYSVKVKSRSETKDRPVQGNQVLIDKMFGQ